MRESERKERKDVAIIKDSEKGGGKGDVVQTAVNYILKNW